MAAMVAHSELFQATDLQRRSRAVLDAAHRPGGAFIRDRDGEALHIGLAEESDREHYLRCGYQSVAGIALTWTLPTVNPASDAAFGELAWLTVVPVEQQKLFLQEYISALGKVPGLGTDAVDQLVYEWQQTARAWADESLRDELLADVPEPLHDSEL